MKSFLCEAAKTQQNADDRHPLENVVHICQDNVTDEAWQN